jgi:hypothetical protein
MRRKGVGLLTPIAAALAPVCGKMAVPVAGTGWALDEVCAAGFGAGVPCAAGVGCGVVAILAFLEEGAAGEHGVEG